MVSTKDGINKECSSCRETKSVLEFWKAVQSPDGYFFWCKDCFKKRRQRGAKRQYKNNPRYFRDKIRKLTRYYVKIGVIKKVPCLICDSTDSEIHHENYNDPKDILWLCHKHHMQHHKILKAFNIPLEKT